MAGSTHGEVSVDAGDVSAASLSLASAALDPNELNGRKTAADNENESASESGSDDSDDPMAWADLEAFGGARRSLQRAKPPRKPTPEQVRAQLAELRALDHKMVEREGPGGQSEGHGHRGIAETVAWLKRHNASHQKRRRSSAFVRSVLALFSRRESNNEEDEAPEQADAAAMLRAPWGQEELGVDWTELGFCLLNQPIWEDMNRVRAFVDKDELMSVSSQGLAALTKWLQIFDQHVHFVLGLKEYLLEERTLVAGVGYRVTTLYEAFDETLAAAIAKVDDDRRDFGDAILSAFAELDAILKDEVIAVKDVISQTLTETNEYAALTSLFSELSEEDSSGGVIVAKLLGWMKSNMKDRDVRSFLALFRPEVQDRIAGDWMRQYASYLHLLDEFSVTYDSSLTFFT